MSSSSTITDFCKRHCFSRGKWYLMEARGTGPRCYREGRSVRITDRAEADWIAAREAAADAEKAAK